MGPGCELWGCRPGASQVVLLERALEGERYSQYLSALRLAPGPTTSSSHTRKQCLLRGGAGEPHKPAASALTEETLRGQPGSATL